MDQTGGRIRQTCMVQRLLPVLHPALGVHAM